MSSLMSPTLKRTTSGLSKRSLQTGEPQVLQNTFYYAMQNKPVKGFHPVQHLSHFLYLSDGRKSSALGFWHCLQ